MPKTIFTLADFVKGMPHIIKLSGDEYLILSVSDDGKEYSVNENDEQVWSYQGDKPEFFVKHINDIISSRTDYLTRLRRVFYLGPLLNLNHGRGPKTRSVRVGRIFLIDL